MGIKLLTMEKWSDESVLIRLENMGITGEPISVNINILFPGSTIASTVETTLDGNLPLSDLKRMKWTTDQAKSNQVEKGRFRELPDVELNPKRIRSFLVKLD
jgi:hypothetical protein